MSRAGFSQIAIMNEGTLSTTPAGTQVIGITRNAELKITRFKPIKVEHRDWDLPNKDNLMLTAETLAPSMGLFKSLTGWLEGNNDAQIITRAQSSTSGSEDVLSFEDGSNLGIEFKYIINDDYRLIQVDLERAFSPAAWSSIVAGAEAATAVVISGSYDLAKYRLPNLHTLTIGGVELENIISRQLTIETKRKAKTIDNVSLVDNIIITAEITFENASFTKLDAIRDLGISPALVWKETNDGTNYDLHSIAAGRLVMLDEPRISETDREIKLTLKGSVPIEACVFTFGTGNGGAAEDTTGVTGGTLTIS